MLAYSILFAALSNAVFLLLILANANVSMHCLGLLTHSLFTSSFDLASCTVLLICWFYLLL